MNSEVQEERKENDKSNPLSVSTCFVLSMQQIYDMARITPKRITLLTKGNVQVS